MRTSCRGRASMPRREPSRCAHSNQASATMRLPVCVPPCREAASASSTPRCAFGRRSLTVCCSPPMAVLPTPTAATPTRSTTPASLAASTVRTPTCTPGRLTSACGMSSAMAQRCRRSSSGTVRSAACPAPSSSTPTRRRHACGMRISSYRPTTAAPWVEI